MDITPVPGDSAVDRALTDTQRRIEQLKREMEQLEAVGIRLQIVPLYRVWLKHKEMS